MTVLEAFDAFIVALAAEGASNATLAWYRIVTRRFLIKHGAARLEALTVDLLRRFVVALRAERIAHETLRGNIRGVKRFLSWAWQEFETGGACPAARIKIPRPEHPMPRAIRIEDARSLISACGNTPQGYRDRAIIMFLLDTGCRAGGLLALSPDDVDLTKRVARLREKGGRERLVPFTGMTALAIRKWLEFRPKGASQLFCSLRTGKHGYGRQLTTTGLRLMLYRLAKKAGVHGRVNPHSFRHAFAREYLSNGGDLATLSQVLGHRDVSTTANFYVRYSVEELSAMHLRYSPIGQMFRKEARDD